MSAREQQHAAGRRAAMEVHFEVSQFLAREAALLDEHRYSEWFELLAVDVQYRMPVAVTLAGGSGPEPGGSMAHFDDDYYSLSQRVRRLLSERAWTEDPPSRTRRYVTNVVAGPDAGTGELEVSSYMLLFRSRLDVRAPEWVSTARRDTVRRVDMGGFLLARRDITVDEAVLRTQNLAVFL